MKDIALLINVTIGVTTNVINLLTPLTNIIPQFTRIVNGFPTNFTKVEVVVDKTVKI
jgi:hypothetical protein